METQFPMMALVKRELVVTLRRKRSYAFLLVLTGFSSFIVVASWPGRESIASIGRWSSMFFQVTGGYVLGALGLVLPAHAAGSIVGERNRGTFDLLNMTLIRTSGIVTAKLLNTVGYALLLLVSLMPLLACALFLVGLEVGQVVAGFSIILASVLSATMFGILSSAMARRDRSAIGGSYLLMMFFRGGVAVLAGLVVWAIGRGDAGEVMGGVFSIVSPSIALSGTFLGVSPRSGMTVMVVGYQIAVAGLCYFLAVVLLRRGTSVVAVKSGKAARRSPGAKRKELGSLARAARRYLGKGEIEDGRNPVFVRELRWGVVGRMTTLIGSFLVSLVIPSLMAFFGAFREGGAEAVYAWLGTHMAITLMLAPSVLSTSFTKEFEDGNFEMLRITPLRPREVVMGKIHAGMVSLTPLFLGGLLWAIILSVMMPQTIPALFGGFVTLFVCCELCMGISLFASIRSRRSSTASLISYALCGFLIVGFLAWPLSPIRAFIDLIDAGWTTVGILWWIFNLLVSLGIAFAFVGGTVVSYRQKMTDG